MTMIDDWKTLMVLTVPDGTPNMMESIYNRIDSYIPTEYTLLFLGKPPTEESQDFLRKKNVSFSVCGGPHEGFGFFISIVKNFLTILSLVRKHDVIYTFGAHYYYGFIFSFLSLGKVNILRINGHGSLKEETPRSKILGLFEKMAIVLSDYSVYNSKSFRNEIYERIGERFSDMDTSIILPPGVEGSEFEEKKC